MSLWTVLLTGFFAGGASCAAIQGGLLAGTLARRRPVPDSAGSQAQPPITRQPGAMSARGDMVPVGAFLTGKLASHLVLGAALGLLGDAVQVGPNVRAYMQIAAGLVTILLALELLGVAALRRFVPTAPPAWASLVRRSGRLGGSLGPALLGGATVVIPCGVTLSMMFLAIASGSALAGAAIMATFVLGTAPLFAVIGYAARRSVSALRGRLGVLAGAAVLVAGLVAINAGLVLIGSPLTIARAWQSATGGDAAPVAAPPMDPDGIQRIVIEAHDTGYSPSNITAQAGVPTEITIRTKNTQGCTAAIVMSFAGIQRVLPASGDTRLDVGELRPGTHHFSCAMGMYGGSITAVARG